MFLQTRERTRMLVELVNKQYTGQQLKQGQSVKPKESIDSVINT